MIAWSNVLLAANHKRRETREIVNSCSTHNGTHFGNGIRLRTSLRNNANHLVTFPLRAGLSQLGDEPSFRGDNFLSRHLLWKSSKVPSSSDSDPIRNVL